jgi:hypothetical protein
VTPGRAIREPAALVWVGVVGPPLAWTTQHVTGYALTQAHCSVAGRGGSLPVGALTAGVTAVAAAVVVLAGLASLAVFAPPATRAAIRPPRGSASSPSSASASRRCSCS